MELPSTNVTKFRELITKTMPNARVFGNTSLIKRAGINLPAKKTVAKAIDSYAYIKKPGTEGTIISDAYVKKLAAEILINSDFN